MVTSITKPAPSQGLAMKYRIEGMDCPSCAGKIETALSRVPGVSAVKVNYLAQSLLLTADEGQAPASAIGEALKKLGYSSARIDGSAQEAANSDRPESAGTSDDHTSQGTKHWWSSTRGLWVLATGAAVGLAFAASMIAPDVSRWAFVVAALAGLFPIARRAFALARSGSPFSIETLMTVATLGALAIDAASEAAVVVFLFMVGELLEGVAAGSARAGIRALISLVPRTATVEEDGKTREVPAASLAIDQVVMVRPGERIPTDGVILDGISDVDESPVTGESVPVTKRPDDPVFAGSINAAAALRITVTRTASDNTIARIIQMVEEAQGSKAPTARFIDRFSAWYTPAAMAIAALVILVPPLAFGADWYTWIYRGLSLLLIACPCALVLSTPAAIASGIASGARRGLLLKGGAALETIGRVRTVAFDKTGTLTEGRPCVTDVIPLSGEAHEMLAFAAAVERGSSHPLARAIVECAESNGVEKMTASGETAIPGKAVLGLVRDRNITISSPRYATERGITDTALHGRVINLELTGKTVVVVLADGVPLGLLALRDEPRSDASEGIAALSQLGVRSVMLTGDNRRTGEAIARTLGLEVQAELLPDDKLKAIAEHKAAGPIAMVGDGINDAPALAAASVGIAMGGSTDVALETADAALLKSRVMGVAELVALSRATLANIHQNIAVSLGFKGVFLITSLLGVTTLWMAILADTGATVLVTLNALRLLGWRSPKSSDAQAD